MNARLSMLLPNKYFVAEGVRERKPLNHKKPGERKPLTR